MARPAARRPRVRDFAQGEIARLEELRLAALERRFERELADGRHAELVGRARGGASASTRCASASRLS